jgi:hypothetical protein
MTNERTESEKLVRKLVAMNDLRIPFSSLYQKNKKFEKEYALGISAYAGQKADFGNSVTAYVSKDEKQKARGMEEGIAEFTKQYPRYGKILQGIVEEKRTENEVYLNYGLNEGYKLNDNEYVSVMRDIGLNDAEASVLFPTLMQVSERLKKKQKEGLREILIGK